MIKYVVTDLTEGMTVCSVYNYPKALECLCRRFGYKSFEDAIMVIADTPSDDGKRRKLISVGGGKHYHIVKYDEVTKYVETKTELDNSELMDCFTLDHKGYYNRTFFKSKYIYDRKAALIASNALIASLEKQGIECNVTESGLVAVDCQIDRDKSTDSYYKVTKEYKTVNEEIGF